MAIPKKGTGAGTKISFSTDGSAYTQFASVSKITPPAFSRETQDVTDLNSFEENDQFKEHVGGFIEADEMSIDGFFVKSDAAREAAEAAFYSNEEVYLKITMPAFIGKTVTVKGIITKYQPFGELTPDGGVAFSLSIKPNSKPTAGDAA